MSQSLFASIFVWLKKPRELHDRILSVWLLFIFIKLLLNILEIKHSQLFINKMGMIIVPMLFGPLLYLYVRTLLSPETKFHKKDWIHFIPFILISIYASIFSINKPVYNLHFFEHDGFLIERIVFGLSFYLSITLYTLRTLILLHKHRKRIKDYYSYDSEKITLRWVMFVGILFSVIYILVISSGIFNIFILNREVINPDLFSATGLTLLSIAVSFYGYKQTKPESSLKVPLIPAWTEDEPKVQSKSKYQKSSLKEEDIKLYLQKLTWLMEEEKPYLDGELTLQKLSDKLGITKHHLTQILNTKLIRNFYAFVNEYRIEEVKRRLADPKNRNLKIMSIAYDSGFNSKTSFNTIFKNHTGMTPSEFLEKVQGENGIGEK
jgi:AraC-like DNA-binding protein